jgi:hypothetical protein
MTLVGELSTASITIKDYAWWQPKCANKAVKSAGGGMVSFTLLYSLYVHYLGYRYSAA